MSDFQQQFTNLESLRTKASLHIQTLGDFQVWRAGELINSKEWGRDKTLQLFQFLITARHRRSLHKEQIMDRIWEDSNDQTFKVAMHGINKALEPQRKSRTEPKYILRQAQAYHLNTQDVWIDIDALEAYIALANQYYPSNPKLAKQAYQQAIALYKGVYLPTRLYEDWCSEERERIQVISLGAFVTLAELELDENPLESIRLAQQALLIDATWEDAYRLQMEAYLKKGNRPMAIKTYQQCEKILDREFGIDPLPETKTLYRKIMAIE